MTADEIKEFLDTLYTGQDIDIVLHGRRYQLQGYYTDVGTSEQTAHVEMDDLDAGDDAEFVVWEGTGATVAQVAAELCHAKVWGGSDFDGAASDIKWV